MVFLCSHVEWSETLLSQKDAHSSSSSGGEHKHSNRKTVTDAHTHRDVHREEAPTQKYRNKDPC